MGWDRQARKQSGPVKGMERAKRRGRMLPSRSRATVAAAWTAKGKEAEVADGTVEKRIHRRPEKGLKKRY